MKRKTYTAETAQAFKLKSHPKAILLSALLAATPMSLLAADGDGAWCEHATANSSFPTARHEAGGLSIGNKFYILGGRAARPLERLNAATNTWDMSVAAPMELHHFQPVEWGGKIYAVGAFTCCYPNEVNITRIQIFDPETQNWSEGDEIPTARQRGSAGTVVHNNKIYLVGGNTNGHNGGAVSWFDEYDPATGQWKVLPNAPHSRDHFAAVMVGNKLVASAGRQSTQPNSQANTESAVDVYNFQSGQWMTGFQDIPTPRAGVAAVNYEDEVIVIGGETNQAQAHNQVEALNVNTGLWRSLPTLITGRHGLAAGVIGDDLYVASGNTVAGGGSETSSVERISLSSVAGPATDQDPDNDGLTTSEETNIYGTNPNKNDTDGDSLSDGDELLIHDTNPLLADTDSDGLTDAEEINQHNTNPTKADSDNDGLTDKSEIEQHGTNPTKADSDDDGLTDKSEIEQHSTNPVKADSDDDGLSDGDEIQQYKSDANDADTDDDTLDDGREVLVLGTDPKLSDTDGDGQDDAFEVEHGTDPLNAADYTQDSQPTEPEPEEPDTEKGMASSSGGVAWLMLVMLSMFVRLRRRAH